ncbi:sigma-54 interaction domain-containing protein [Alkaliphilus peptidifermentans]|nr:sigma 54-interacting transcriptional regulator [Alkaliphilus peptidifermentans]
MQKKVKALEDTIDRYKGELSKMYEARYSFEDIITQNSIMMELKDIAKRVTKTNSTVLIQGESGTGKELFAHAFHKESLRRHGNFVTLNCAAIPKELLESEVFGYEEGAFTGAKRGGKIGKFELANGGTILLDEIGSMPINLQSKLLRVLESREFERVGGNKRIKLDVRIIASCNENLELSVQKGTFRRDLYYRLNVIKIDIPPLRERIDDIELLAQTMVSKLAIDLQLTPKTVSSEACDRLKSHNWPGNVRELRNVLERALYFATYNIILPEHLPEYINEKGTTPSSQPSLTLKDMVEKTEIDAIKRAIRDANGSKTIAAEMLDIHRTSLYKKIEKYKLTELMD